MGLLSALKRMRGLNRSNLLRAFPPDRGDWGPDHLEVWSAIVSTANELIKAQGDNIQYTNLLPEIPDPPRTAAKVVHKPTKSTKPRAHSAPEMTAGFAIVRDGAILLAHPTNAKWWGTYSIPKGHVDEGETIEAAAIRETREEVGIRVPKRAIVSGPHRIKYIDKKKERVWKILTYWIVDGSLIKVDDRVPKTKLQLTEIDWAGFISKKEAKKRIHPTMRSIIKRIP